MNFRNSNRSLYPRLREGLSQALFYILVIPALQKLRQELMANYGYTASTRLSHVIKPKIIKRVKNQQGKHHRTVWMPYTKEMKSQLGNLSKGEKEVALCSCTWVWISAPMSVNSQTNSQPQEIQTPFTLWAPTQVWHSHIHMHIKEKFLPETACLETLLASNSRWSGCLCWD